MTVTALHESEASVKKAGSNGAQKQSTQSTVSRPRRLRRLRDGQTPVGALTWVSSRERARLLREWREAVMRRFADEARALRIAWALECLFLRKGYAFASNSKLADKVSMDSIRNVERSLKALADAGAIIRVLVGPERRIFPAAEIIGRRPAKLAGCKTGQVSRYRPAKLAIHTNTEVRTPLSMTQVAARQAAKMRDERHQPEPLAAPSAASSKAATEKGSKPPGKLIVFGHIQWDRSRGIMKPGAGQ